MDGIEACYPRCWLKGRYRDLMVELADLGTSTDGFRLRTVELRERESGLLIAGEIGYTIGATYTSLSGFFKRDGAWSGMGFVQLVLLARELERMGYAFCFTLLEKWAEEGGLQVAGLTTQREFIYHRAKRGMQIRARDNLILDEFGAGTAFKVAEWVANSSVSTMPE